jgi:hypothetical protein
MRYARTLVFAAAASGLAALAGEAQAQLLNQGRDCQTVRACNYGRGGGYRGCLSAYTCRVCRFVPAPCYVDGARKVCQRVRCTWG